MKNLIASASVSAPSNFGKPTQIQPWRHHIDIWNRLAGSNVSSSHFVQIPDACIDELDKAIFLGVNAQCRRVDLIEAMPACAALATELRTELFEKSGFVVLDRLPVKRYEATVNRQLAGLIGCLISPLMAQDRAGTTLYDVLDNGSSKGAVRRSKTNLEQPFHTDGAWLSPAPALIGLFCIQPAMSGGSSQVASLPMALSRLTVQDPTFDLAELCKPVFWNRMGEQQAGDLPYSQLPVLDTQSTAACLRYYVDYVKTGSALAGQSVAQSTIGLFERIDRMLSTTALNPFGLAAGQLQYVNNGWLVHARGQFSDREKGERGRHLVRIWNQHL